MEFVEGAARLRGSAKALDIWRLETKLEVPSIHSIYRSNVAALDVDAKKHHFNLQTNFYEFAGGSPSKQVQGAISDRRGTSSIQKQQFESIRKRQEVQKSSLKGKKQTPGRGT